MNKIVQIAFIYTLTFLVFISTTGISIQQAWCSCTGQSYLTLLKPGECCSHQTLSKASPKSCCSKVKTTAHSSKKCCDSISKYAKADVDFHTLTLDKLISAFHFYPTPTNTELVYSNFVAILISSESNSAIKNKAPPKFTPHQYLHFIQSYLC